MILALSHTTRRASLPGWLPARSLLITHLLSLLGLLTVGGWTWQQAQRADQHQTILQQAQQQRLLAERHTQEQHQLIRQQQAQDEQIQQQLTASRFEPQPIMALLETTPLLRWRNHWTLPNTHNEQPETLKHPTRLELHTEAPHENLLLEPLLAVVQRSPYPLTGWQCDWQRQRSWMLPIAAHCELAFRRFSQEQLHALGVPAEHAPTASAPPSQPTPATLFFSLGEQAALLRDGSPDGPLRINGIVRSSHGGTTVWVNGKAEYQPVQDNLSATPPGATRWRVSHDGQDLLIPGAQGTRHLPIGQPPQAPSGELP